MKLLRLKVDIKSNSSSSVSFLSVGLHREARKVRICNIIYSYEKLKTSTV